MKFRNGLWCRHSEWLEGIRRRLTIHTCDEPDTNHPPSHFAGKRYCVDEQQAQGRPDHPGASPRYPSAIQSPLEPQLGAAAHRTIPKIHYRGYLARRYCSVLYVTENLAIIKLQASVRGFWPEAVALWHARLVRGAIKIQSFTRGCLSRKTATRKIHHPSFLLRLPIIPHHHPLPSMAGPTSCQSPQWPKGDPSCDYHGSVPPCMTTWGQQVWAAVVIQRVTGPADSSQISMQRHRSTSWDVCAITFASQHHIVVHHIVYDLNGLQLELKMMHEKGWSSDCNRKFRERRAVWAR